MKSIGGSHDKINYKLLALNPHPLDDEAATWTTRSLAALVQGLESSSGLDMGRQIGLKVGIRFGFADTWTEATADARPEAFPKLEKEAKTIRMMR